MYKQTILPLVEYAGFLLNLNRKHDTEKLQKLQNRALRLCYNAQNSRDVSVSECIFMLTLTCYVQGLICNYLILCMILVITRLM